MKKLRVTFNGLSMSECRWHLYSNDMCPENQRIQDLLAANIGNQFETLDTRVNNYWRGHWIKHPAQCNLYGLPPEVVTPVLLDFMCRYLNDICSRAWRIGWPSWKWA